MLLYNISNNSSDSSDTGENSDISDSSENSDSSDSSDQKTFFHKKNLIFFLFSFLFASLGKGSNKKANYPLLVDRGGGSSKVNKQLGVGGRLSG